MRKQVVLGIDVGGTKVCIGIVTHNGELLDTVQYPQQYCEIEKWTEKLFCELDKFISKRINEDINAIGIGCRGHVDFRNQMLLDTSIMKVSKNFDLCKALREHYGCPVYIDNDVKAAACGELLFGIGKKYINFACYNIGTGIAVSSVIDGILIRGRKNDAGEIGRDILQRPNFIDKFKGLEDRASGRGIETEFERLVKDHPDSALYKIAGKIHTRDVLEASKQKDDLAVKVIDDALCLLAASVVNIQHMLDLEAFVFTGGVVSDTFFFESLKNKTKQFFEISGSNSMPYMELSDMAINKSGALGAAGVAIYQIKNKI